MTGTALELARRVQAGDATAEEVVAEALDAVHADATNAFTSVDEEALDRARWIDDRLARGERIGPLTGVPLAVKDLIDHEGRTTTAGSGFYRHTAAATAPALARLERAGAVVVGRTGLHEFAFGFSSENPWFGPILNPWDSALSPGGSSGGSAAAVATGVVPIALGTDTGGSVRVPAAMCSIAGLKVTHGRIPLTGVFPLVPSLDTVGPLGTSIDDLAAATVAMAGPDKSDPSSRDLPWDTLSPTSLEGVELVVPRRWVDTAPLSPVVGAAFEQFLAESQAAGMVVRRPEEPDLVPDPHIAAVIGPEVAQVHRAWRIAGEAYGDDVGARIDEALVVTDERAEAARRWRRRVTDHLSRLTRAGAVVVTPTVPDLDKTIGVDAIGSHHYRTVVSWFSSLVNQTGAPALSLPLPGTGRTPSVQLVGAAAGEPWLLAIGRLLAHSGVVRPTLWSSY